MASCSTRRTALVFLALALLSFSGCSSPLNPEAGFPLPKDPGTIVVRVVDHSGPVANVAVAITQPNNIGSTFQITAFTDASGTRIFPGIPAGIRPVEISPPTGYKAGPDGLIQNAEVTKGRTTTVAFTLVREDGVPGAR